MRIASVTGPLTAVAGATTTLGWMWTSLRHPWVWTLVRWTQVTKRSYDVSVRWRKRMTSWFRWPFVFVTTYSPSIFKALQNLFFCNLSIALIEKHPCPSVSVKIVCAGNMAPAWACWKTMFQTDTPATSAGTHQVREKHHHHLQL